MDEVDGMAGNEDRGGIQVLLRLARIFWCARHNFLSGVYLLYELNSNLF